MTRWAMIADLNRCVGCQTCTSACKHTNVTPPSVQWRQVLDVEAGEFPDVKRAFVPVGCMHCEDPPCMHVRLFGLAPARGDEIAQVLARNRVRFIVLDVRSLRKWKLRGPPADLAFTSLAAPVFRNPAVTIWQVHAADSM